MLSSKNGSSNNMSSFFSPNFRAETNKKAYLHEETEEKEEKKEDIGENSEEIDEMKDDL